MIPREVQENNLYSHGYWFIFYIYQENPYTTFRILSDPIIKFKRGAEISEISETEITNLKSSKIERELRRI